MTTPSDEELMLMPSQEAVAHILKAKGLPTPPITSHLFKPGDASYGWEKQCSVVVPTQEAGEIVGAHCGAPVEEHIQETYHPGPDVAPREPRA